MTPAHVYFVVWWFDRFGGMERHVTDIAKALARTGVRVSVFSETPLARSNQYASELRQAGISVFAPHRIAYALTEQLQRSRAFQRGPMSQTAGFLFRALERHARRSPPDIVHVHGCRMGQHGVIQWAASHRYPSVYTEHVTIADWGGPFVPESPRILATAADAIACVSEYSRASLLGYLPWPRDVHVARHIIRDPRPPDLADVGPCPPVAWRAGRPVSILAVGRLVSHKGYDTLFQAAALLREEGMALDIRIAGEGEQRAALEALRARLGLADAVTFLGQVDPSRISALWREADIGVMPSLTEGLPLSLVEAMAQAKPIIATRVGGIPEVIRHEHNGLLVESGDAVQLASAIARVVRDPALATRLAAEARKSFETDGWSESSVTEQTLAIYDEARSRSAGKDAVEPFDLSWARARAADEVRPISRVWIFTWAFAAFGDMEHLIAEQAAALALSGVEVLLFVEQPAGPFNRYVRRARRAGVRVIVSSPPGFAARRAWSRLVSRLPERMANHLVSTPIPRVLAAANASCKPDVIHVHGWRLTCGWESAAAALRIANEQGIASVYSEHASDDDPLGDVARSGVHRVDALSAASPAAAILLAKATEGLRPVTVMRHARGEPPRPPPLDLVAPVPFRAFALLPEPEICRLAQDVRSETVEIEPASRGLTHADQIAACHAVVLSPGMEGFRGALAEAMSTFKPVILCGPIEGAPIHNRANGFAVVSNPAAALLELAADPLLAHQFSLAARETYDQIGLRHLAVVAEAAALYREAAGTGRRADADR